MTNPTRYLATPIFAAIALFLVGYTWVPARQSLQREEGKITHIISRPNTWYEVEITTSSSTRVSCRSRRGWPLAGPNRCPLEVFEHYLGQTVSVLHDGIRPYEVAVGNQMVIDYSVHRQTQALAFGLAGLMLTMAFWIWKRK